MCFRKKMTTSSTTRASGNRIEPHYHHRHHHHHHHHHHMNKVYFLLIFIQQQQQQHQLKIISVFQIMTRQTAAVRKQILDAYYIFKKDSELKKLIQEKLPEKYSYVFTLRNLLTDMEKFIHKNILFDEAIIIRDYNLEEVDGFDASEEMKTSSDLPPSSDKK